MADVAESPAMDPHERAFRELLARWVRRRWERERAECGARGVTMRAAIVARVSSKRQLAAAAALEGAQPAMPLGGTP